MAEKIIIGNWKMNLSSVETEDLISRLRKSLKMYKENVQVVVCPAFTSLEKASVILGNSKIRLGAQDLFWEDKGAFTGEISPQVLKEIGVEFVIVGHSERRKYLGETDEIINAKIKAGLRWDLTPILCVGETFEQRQKGQTALIVEKQVRKALWDIKELKNPIIVAYEPVWAVGTGQAIEAKEAKEEAKIIITTLVDNFPDSIDKGIFSIIYGGSVDEINVLEFVDGELICGVLVGGASIEADKFLAILEKISKN